MVRELYENLCMGREVRQSLIALKQELKEEQAKRSFAYLLGGDYRRIAALLKDEDPKVRKNEVGGQRS